VGRAISPKDKGQVMTYTEPELKTNEYGITYYPTAIEIDEVGLHFFLDEHYELICASSYKDGGYEDSNLDYVENFSDEDQKNIEQEDIKEQLRIKNNIPVEDYYGLPF
jgi:hypothetical protein